MKATCVLAPRPGSKCAPAQSSKSRLAVPTAQGKSGMLRRGPFTGSWWAPHPPAARGTRATARPRPAFMLVEQIEAEQRARIHFDQP